MNFRTDGRRLKVWWIPQVPTKAFEVEVETLWEAHLILDTLARYDQFQLDNNVKPDYSNAGGLVVFEDDGWFDWWIDDERGYWDSFDDYRNQHFREDK